MVGRLFRFLWGQTAYFQNRTAVSLREAKPTKKPMNGFPWLPCRFPLQKMHLSKPALGTTKPTPWGVSQKPTALGSCFSRASQRFHRCSTNRKVSDLVYTVQWRVPQPSEAAMQKTARSNNLKICEMALRICEGFETAVPRISLPVIRWFSFEI